MTGFNKIVDEAEQNAGGFQTLVDGHRAFARVLVVLPVKQDLQHHVEHHENEDEKLLVEIHNQEYWVDDSLADVVVLQEAIREEGNLQLEHQNQEEHEDEEVEDRKRDEIGRGWPVELEGHHQAQGSFLNHEEE